MTRLLRYKTLICPLTGIKPEILFSGRNMALTAPPVAPAASRHRIDLVWLPTTVSSLLCEVRQCPVRFPASEPVRIGPAFRRVDAAVQLPELLQRSPSRARGLWAIPEDMLRCLVLRATKAEYRVRPKPEPRVVSPVRAMTGQQPSNLFTWCEPGHVQSVARVRKEGECQAPLIGRPPLFLPFLVSTLAKTLPRSLFVRMLRSRLKGAAFSPDLLIVG